MAKIELKGYILTVNQPETVGEKNTAKQTIIFKVPGYVDGFGDKKGQDEEWPLDILGDNVSKLNMTRDHQGKKAKCIVYVNGQKFTRKTDNTEGWIINAKLHEIQVFDDKPAQSSAPNNTGSTNSNW
ncbi:hypothetical protein DBR40_24850 [Pedobacter sp. KBW01]|uniref:hypothetical protein n=1 Tax=Pedobacter sp. KBW01 TaxID=2153364 RepID=UPI000F5B2AA9|nr:hypothetical protein [Pedobacter sp. KBW01]RQO65103.1 hypothetical protein DBR40_24850 [Pedobacter sp. KBW01]